jgi:uncharacterized protein (TIGR03083 family)
MADISYGDALIEQNCLLGELLRGADWSTPVPTCPGWSLLQLMRHVGRGDRWAAQIISEGSGEVDPRQVPGGRPPDDEAGAIEWLFGGPPALLDAVAAAGPSTPAWTFIGPQPAEWWVRRRLHEATVHRADVALSLERGYQLDPVLASDGISEWFSLTSVLFPPEGTIALRASDGNQQEWLLGEGRPDVTLRGRSEDLLLALTGRADTSDLVVDGNRAGWDGWLRGVNF